MPAIEYCNIAIAIASFSFLAQARVLQRVWGYDVCVLLLRAACPALEPGRAGRRPLGGHGRAIVMSGRTCLRVGGELCKRGGLLLDLSRSGGLG